MNNNPAARQIGGPADYSQIAAEAAPAAKSGGFSFSNWMTAKVLSYDVFAKPITLKYDKKPAFSTLPGGIIGFTFIYLYLSFSLLSFIDFIKYAEDIQQTNNRKLDFFDDNDKQWVIPTTTVNLMHLIGTDNETLGDLEQYVGAQYVQINSTYESFHEGLIPSKNCAAALGEESVQNINEDDESFEFYAKRLQCPDIDQMELRGSNLITQMFKKNIAQNPKLRNLTAGEFRLVVNTCQDIHGPDDSRCEKDEKKLRDALNQIYVDVTILSQYLDLDESHVFSVKKSVNQAERYFLGYDVSNLVEKQIKQKDVTFFHDWMFGTQLLSSNEKIYALYAQEQRTFQRWAIPDIAIHPIDPTYASVNNYLLTVRINQDQFREVTSIHPVSFYQFVSLIFAFWFLLLNIGRQLLQKYLGFVWNKSLINKMYFYSRQKQNTQTTQQIKSQIQDEQQLDDDSNEIKVLPDIDSHDSQNRNKSQKVYTTSEKQFFEDHKDKNLMTNIKEGHAISELEHEHDDDEKSEEDSISEKRDMELRQKLFRAVMHSKSHLIFGYKHVYALKFFRYVKCFCRCLCGKWCNRKYQRYTTNEKRMKNAGVKINDEFDLINIIKRLRVNQFIANLTLSPYQQQAIDYFYEYSLENKHARNKDWKNLNLDELIEIVNNNLHNPINQLINQKVIGVGLSDEGGEADQNSDYVVVTNNTRYMNPNIYLKGDNRDESSDEHLPTEVEQPEDKSRNDSYFVKQQSYLEAKGHSLFMGPSMGTQYKQHKSKKYHRATFGLGEMITDRQTDKSKKSTIN